MVPHNMSYVAFNFVTWRFFLDFLPPHSLPLLYGFQKVPAAKQSAGTEPANSLPGLFPWELFICWLILFRGIHTEVITSIRTAFLAQSLECISLLWQPCCGVRLLLVLSLVSLGRS